MFAAENHRGGDAGRPPASRYHRRGDARVAPRQMTRTGILVLAIGLAVFPAPVSTAADDPTSGIEIDFVNGVYEDLDSNLQPIRQGSITINVSSPEHRLTVHGNRLSLEPNGDGTLAAVIEVEFEGRGHLIADVEGIGRFEDNVEAPRQTARAAGTVGLTRAAGGYLFTVEAADPSVRLEIVSGVASQVVGACRTLALLPFVRLPCGGLEKSLQAVDVPMPGPGEQIQVRADLLTDEERAFLDRHVADR